MYKQLHIQWYVNSWWWTVYLFEACRVQIKKKKHKKMCNLLDFYTIFICKFKKDYKGFILFLFEVILATCRQYQRRFTDSKPNCINERALWEWIGNKIFEECGLLSVGSDIKKELSYWTNSAKLFTNWETFIFWSMHFVGGTFFV